MLVLILENNWIETGKLQLKEAETEMKNTQMYK